MLSLSGYQIDTQIYESANSLVYRGVREQDNQRVILKVLKQDYPTRAELTRYKQEYEITRNLNLDGVVKAYGLEPYQRTLVLILEDNGCESLKRILLPRVEEFLAIAIKITATLGQIHAANVIHKDINPSNIVFNPKTGEVKIIDFGIATVFTRENYTGKNPNVLEGTLAYMSPEQTGRMNRSVDYRTDFYSLGATFYELLTQQLPFDTKDSLELVHCHLAKQPIPPHEINSEIPKSLSDIVMKLMAKTAEERYQSAYGIKVDLEACLHQYQTGNMASFFLGSGDIADKFQIPQKLYGREAEVETLVAAFERVAGDVQSQIELMLVAGYSGIGKSSLVQELFKPITKQRGYFIDGKFDQFQRNIPYSAIVKAFKALIRQILTESETQLGAWKEKLLAALGVNGQVIIDVIPELELIVGKQPPVQELAPAEAQNRFNLVFQNFIRVFCQKEHPLVIFLDDLQWADSATLNLIELMMRDEKLGYLFLIGAYRDNEVNPTHPTIITIEGLKKQGAIANQITLKPLNLEHITQLIADTLQLGSGLQTIGTLAELILNKTGGNPFFVNQFLKTLYQEKLLTFDYQLLAWQWDIAQIEAMGITDNVVDLMIGKLKKLPLPTQQVLRLSACVGNSFDLTTLSIIHEKSAGETFSDLLPAIQTGLIIPVSELEITEEDLIKSPLLILNYKFLHDRVQQAAYALIDDDKKRLVHLQIGRLLLHNLSKTELETRMFEVADHLNLGRESMTDDEKIELSTLNLSAGKKAKEATAYAAAMEYLKSGIDCLTGDFWTNHYDLAFALHKEQAEVEYLNGNFEQAEASINLVLSRAKTAIEKAEIYNLLIVQYTLVVKYSEAIQAGRKALQLLGIELPSSDLQAAFRIEVAEIENKVGNREIASLIDEPEMTNLEQILANKLLINLIAPGYLFNQDIFAVIVAKAVNLSLTHGHSTDSSHGYSSYGVILTRAGNYQLAYEFGMLALKLCDKFNNLSLKCRDSMLFGSYMSPWIKHFKASDTIFTEGFQTGLSSGDIQFSGYIFTYKTINLFVRGEYLYNILTETYKFLHYTHKTKNQFSTDVIRAFQLPIFNLTGQTTEPLNFDNEIISEAEYLSSCRSHQSVHAIGYYQILQSLIFYLYGEFDLALKLSEESSKLLPLISGTVAIVEHAFYHSLILAALYPNVPEAEQKQYWQQLETNQNQMKIWADTCPDNFLHKYLLVAAEMARISGQDLAALDFYDGAIKSAQEHEFIQNEALANELAGKFWIGKGKEHIAKLYLTEACYGYQLWGAKRKVEDLLEKYPHLIVKKQAVNLDTTEVTRTTITSEKTPIESLDVATVIKASQAISEKIVLSELLKELMEIVIENAGASNGCLILKRGEKLAVEVLVDKEGSVFVQPSISLDSALPLSIINYVERTQEDVVLADATSSSNFALDSYLQSQKPKSVLATAIINGGKLIGILYLENNLMVGAFTRDRLKILNLLCSQAAISLENAILYNTLEQKVIERTSELSQALKDLKATQKRLVESEKMAALGSLVAGVAHEINTPVGTSITAASTLADETGVFANALAQGNLKRSILQNYIDIAQESVDLIINNLQRAGELIQSFKQVSVDQTSLERRTFTVKPYLEEVLVSLAPKLKHTSHKLTVEGDETITIDSYPGALAQILTNLVVNSLTHAYQEGEAGELRFEVKQQGASVQILYGDDGCGIPQAHLSKIFDPFFTTARNRGGSGLGLHIVYNLVTQKLKGTIDVKSRVGEGTLFIVTLPLSVGE